MQVQSNQMMESLQEELKAVSENDRRFQRDDEDVAADEERKRDAERETSRRVNPSVPSARIVGRCHAALQLAPTPRIASATVLCDCDEATEPA